MTYRQKVLRRRKTAKLCREGNCYFVEWKTSFPGCSLRITAAFASPAEAWRAAWLQVRR